MRITSRHMTTYLVCFLLLPCNFVMAEIQDHMPVARFSEMSLSDLTPPGWQPLVFASIPTQTAYFLNRDNGRTVVQAVSHGSASGYFKPLRLSAKDWPIIKWQWKIDHVLENSNPFHRDGDDYPARIYISFAYDPNRLTGLERLKYKLYMLSHTEPPPLAVLNYIWDKRTARDTLITNAFSKRVKMIVIESGNRHAGRWRWEQRDVVADYKRAFGEEPGDITGVAIMTDTDNTGESVTAWYGDISFHKRKWD